MIVLDTDIVTLFAYGNEKIRKRVEDAEEESLAVTLITRMEILQGRHDSILKASNAVEMQTAVQRFQAAEDMLDDFALLYPDEISGRYFEALLKPKKGKKKMRRADMLIASIVLAHDALLVTRNTKDFQGINGLRIENWAD